MPTRANRMAVFAHRSEEVAAHAATVRPIVHRDAYDAMEAWLADRRAHGSVIQQDLYKDMDVRGLLTRLLRCRPLAFLTSADAFLLREGRSGSGGFDEIGTTHQGPDLLLSNLLSYDEMAWSALVGVSVPTHFINAGGRFNRGETGSPGSFEDRGIYVGLVGARFERAGRMEWQHMLVTPGQNRAENGYGPSGTVPGSAALKIWAKLYGLSHLPTYEEAKSDTSDRYRQVGSGLLDAHAYRARMRMSVEPFLREANDRAISEGKQAYAHAVGLGLGVWQLSPVQRELMLRVYRDVLETVSLPGLADVDFSWFGESTSGGGLADGAPVNDVQIHFSKRDPAAKLTGVDAGKLLVAQYAWDANAFPGNEYWMGSLAASGDPAAACCSMIPELQNPDVNPAVSGERAVVW